MTVSSTSPCIQSILKYGAAMIAGMAMAIPTALASQAFGVQSANMLPKSEKEWQQMAQAVWNPGFDTGASGQTVRNASEPTLSPSTSARIEFAIGIYESVVRNGGWNKVPNRKILKLGISNKAVSALRRRLIISGDLDQRAGLSNVYDHYVRNAVMRFQARHGLTPDGIVQKTTFDALNVSAEDRLRQLRNNAARMKDLSLDTSRYIMVNIPAASIEFVEGGRVVSRHTAVVGKIDRQTPILRSKIVEVNFNPYWTVPKSIIRKDLIPKMNEDPTYLKRFRIRIFDEQNNEIQPEQVNWQTQEAVNYRFTQDPGELNSLGSVRINFPNSHQVYLHDTPGKNLFGENYRFHSSGCVRVANIREFVTRLLYPNGWNRAQVDRAIRSGQRLDVPLKSQIPLFMSYVTAWVTDAGVVQFRDDIYVNDNIETAMAVETQ